MVRRLKPSSFYIIQVCLSPDGKLLASNGDLWEVSTGKLLGRFKEDFSTDAMAFAPDSRTVAMATRDGDAGKGGTIRLWDATTCKEIKRFGKQPVHAIAYSSDGKTMAAGGGDGTITVWDVTAGRELRRIRGHRREVNSVAFSPGGKILASSSFDGDIFLWEAATGKRIRQLVANGSERGHVNVIAVEFAPNGKTLASAEQPFTSSDGASITLWDIATGQVRLRLVGHQGDVRGLAFAGDSRTLVSSSADTTSLVWDLTAAPRTPLSKSMDLSARQVEAMWTDLLSLDAARGYRATCTLALWRGGVKFLERRLPLPSIDSRRIAALVAALDSSRFRERSNATRELEKLGQAAEPALRKALEGQPSVEWHQRLTRLLERATAEWPRTERAVEALELMATPEARDLLRSLAKGPSRAQLTQEAKSALDRWKTPRATPTATPSPTAPPTCRPD
jgi:hypothetical protein